ncbi:hypothetical protein MHF_0849 [Mycoplasma haemofelis Ohio2]|uniref:Uncharacterized protein n=1 Tax=Mycoplasma haemofelis (strain Ohio2) TaxID=859194 RepID=F6FIR5_MYCHI|nr:hypothetical protein MHF_0849 [Mycoplasma haemofelis Ohio2]
MDAKALALAGLGTTGAVGGGAYWYASNSNKQSHPISDLLKQEKTRFALRKNSGSSFDSKWKAAWARYRKAHEVSTGKYQDRDTWGIPNWNEKKGQEEVFNEFKDMCESKYQLSIESPDDVEYKNVRKWCTASRTIKELIEGEKQRSILPETGEDAGWNTAWNSYKEHHKEANGNTYKSSNEWGITDWNAGSLGTSATANFKSKCKEKYSADIDFEKELSDPLINQVVNWCTKPIKP